MKKPRLVAIPIKKQTLRERHRDKPAANEIEYQEAIGSLHYTATISRPDISYATEKLARYAENHSLIHRLGV